MVGILTGAIALWKLYLTPAPLKVASVERMKHPLPDKPSIAVLPFVNMSEDPGQEFFSDGLTEEITTSLSRLPQVFVIARNSAFIYKGKPIRIGQVAEELGVRYVVEGSVRRAGEKVRINAQLIDAIQGHHLWAERYEGSMKDVFALQDQITQKIVSALAVKLTESEKELIIPSGTGNVAAYDEFLKGWVHYLRMTPDDMAKALQAFKKATELDPDFARAHAALALAYWTGSSYSGMGKGLGISFAEARIRSRQYLAPAMKRPTSIAHAVNSQFYLYRRQHEEALSELEQAIRLDPNDPFCNALMGAALLFIGRPGEAVDFLNRAMRLDPQNPSFYLARLGAAQFCLGNLEEAANVLERALRLNPELSPMITGFLAPTYGLLGREQEARAALETHKKGYMATFPRSLSIIMSNYPFRVPLIANRLAEGMIRAGMLGQATDYLPAFPKNRLRGEEIRSLFFGSTITGPDGTGQQWRIDRQKNGELAWSGPGPVASDTGKSRIEGDLLYTQFQKRMWGVEYCATVFRNPNGSRERRDEYFFITDFGFAPFSLLR
jgi:adenylate cyclase